MSVDSKKNTASNGASAPHDFFAQMQQFGGYFGEQWGAAARAQLERWDAATAQWSSWQAEATKRYLEATDEAARLIKSGVTQASKLGEQWQSSGMDATRRALEFMAPRS